ncbi:MAG TPA: hypothetical protein DCY00_05315 [Actinobacteria bacterium]|jgi:hypothetical protein|nr:hypothetical protein [Actinomycetota bacterium]
MDGEYELNSRVLVFGSVFAIIIIAVFFPYQMLEKPKYIPINVTITPTPIIEYIYVTPTPDNGIYYAGEYLSGVRKLGRYFSWYRDNVSGYHDLSGHVKVYDYRIFDHVHAYYPENAKYSILFPAAGKKYLFVFVKIWLDNISGDDVRLFVPDETHFIASVKGNSTQPIKWEKRLRLREFEETTNENGEYGIQYYGTFRKYTRDLEYAPSAGEYADPQINIYAGESNAIDGFIVYEIDTDAQPEDIKIVGNMYAFGAPVWILKI